jgi:hypothetical protein
MTTASSCCPARSFRVVEGAADASLAAVTFGKIGRIGSTTLKVTA